MITPFINGLSIYSNSGNPFQYMHKTGGLDGGPRYSNTGSVGSNYLRYSTGSLLSVKEQELVGIKVIPTVVKL